MVAAAAEGKSSHSAIESSSTSPTTLQPLLNLRLTLPPFPLGVPLPKEAPNLLLQSINQLVQIQVELLPLPQRRPDISVRLRGVSEARDELPLCPLGSGETSLSIASFRSGRER